MRSRQGFNPDHRDIELLKLRNYTVGRQLPDEELHSDDAQEKIMEVIRAMVPFVSGPLFVSQPFVFRTSLTLKSIVSTL